MKIKWICISMLLSQAVYAGTDEARAQIVKVLKNQFERPAASLDVPVVVVSGDFAVAEWLQDNRGGRALLRHDADGWHTLMCGGAQFKSPQALRQAGVQNEDALRISRELAQGERSLTAEQLKKIDSFEGIVDVLANPNHHEHH